MGRIFKMLTDMGLAPLKCRKYLDLGPKLGVLTLK